MGYFISIFISYFIIFLLIISFVFLLGHLVFMPFKKKEEDSFFVFFYKILSGTILTITIYSIIISNFRTINLVFALIFLFFYLNERPQWQGFSIKRLLDFGITKKHLLFIIFIGIIIFSYLASFKIPENENKIPQYFFDEVFYTKIIDYLNLTGNENIFQEANIINIDFHGITTYHYFELWFTAFIVKITGMLTFLVFELVTIPFLVFLISMGMLALLETIKKIVWYDLFIILIFLFFSGIKIEFFDKYDFYNSLSRIHNTSIMAYFTGPKVLLQTSFLLMSILLIKKGRMNIAFIPLISLSLINVSVVPAVIGSTIFVNLLAIIIPLNLKKQQSIINITQATLVLLFIGIVLYLFSPNLDYLGNLKIKDVLFNNIKNFSASKINYIAGILITNVLHFISFIALLLIGARQVYNLAKKQIELQLLLLILFSMIMIAFIMIIFLSGIPDYFQFYENIFISIRFLLFFIVFIYLFYNKSKYLYPFITFVILTSIYNLYLDVNYRIEVRKPIYSERYISKIRNLIPTIKNPLGACSYTDIYGQSGPPTHNKLGSYLKFISNYYNTVSLSSYYLFFNPETNPVYFLALKTSAFNYYVKKKTNNYSLPVKEDSLKQAFIKEYKIEYIIIAEPDTIPNFLKSMIKEEIIDTFTKERFIVLNPTLYYTKRP